MNYSGASPGVSLLALYVVKQTQLLLVKTTVVRFLTLLLDITLDDFLAAMTTHRRYEIARRPKRPLPEQLAHLRVQAPDTPGRDALDDPRNLRRTVGGHRLHQKVHMVEVAADLDELDLVAFGDLQADVPQRVVDCRVEDHTAVLRRTDEVVEQERDVVALMDVAAHKRP